MAGLDPATHVLFDAKSAANEDVDDRVKPGQGEFCGGEGGKFDDSELENLNRTAVGLTRPSTWIPGTSPGMTIAGVIELDRMSL